MSYRSQNNAIPPCPYRGWDLYMRENWEDFCSSDQGVVVWYQTLVDVLIENFQQNESILKNSADIERLRRVPLDYLALCRDFQDEDFSRILEARPEAVFTCMGLALYQV